MISWTGIQTTKDNMTNDEWVEAYKEMLASLPDVNKAIKEKYAAQTMARYKPEAYEEASRVYDEALEESRRIQGDFYDRARAAGVCPGCLDKNGPRHDASSRCESGGRNHCTCDVCF